MSAGLSSPEPEDGGPVSRDAAFLPDGVTPGATNLPDPGQSPTRSGQDGSGDLRARLAGLVRQPFEGAVSTPTASYANAVADAVLADGFRRVVEDEDTIERLARAIWASTLHPDLADDGSWEWAKSKTAGYHARARAAVRALREETDGWVPGDPVYPDEASRRWCTHCLTGWTGGPVACPDCGHDSIEGCPSCGARDGCPGCINPPEESR